jgi:cobalt-zinc-cadmium efflux system outer membrane protein
MKAVANKTYHPMIQINIAFGLLIIMAVNPMLLLASEIKNGQTSEHVQQKLFEDQNELNLEQLLQFAQANNPSLKSLYVKWNSVKEKAPQASVLPDPKLTYGGFIQSVQTRTGPQEHNIGLSQTIPWFGKLSLKEQIAIKEAEAIYQEYAMERLRLFESIKTAFYEYAFLKSEININTEHLELLGLMERIASMRFTTGTLPQSSLIQLQVEQGKIEDRIKELRTLRPALSSVIYAAIGLHKANIFAWPKNKIDMPRLEIDENNLKAALLNNNPELKKMDLLIGRQQSAIELTKKEYYPDITFGAQWSHIEGGEDPLQATISFNLPIWRASLDASKKEAILKQQSITDALLDRKNNLMAQLDLALYDFNNAKRKVKLYQNTLIPKATQSIEVSLKGFETAGVNISELLDSQRTLLEFQLTYQRQLANANQRLASIYALSAFEIENNQTERKTP